MENGRTVRRGTFIDIPLVYDMPHFAKDDSLPEDDPLHGHFVLVLQSFLCHQGTRTDSGHYISAARSRTPGDGPDRWLLMDDLAKERVSYINDIRKFLDKEKPYLLFYRVEPIGSEPPPYRESADKDSGVAGLSDPQSNASESRDEEAVITGRHSLDSSVPEHHRGRSSVNSDRPQSLVFSDSTPEGSKANSTPFLTAEPQQDSGDASRRGSQTSKIGKGIGRSHSKRSSMSLSRLAERLSKEKSSTSLSRPSTSEGPKPNEMPKMSDIRAMNYSTNFGDRHGFFGQHRLDKPERECVLM